MTSVLRVAVSRVACGAPTKTLLSNGNSDISCFFRCISGKAKRAAMPPETLPPPFPWRDRPLRVWHYLTDKTSKRFGENSKVIIVDGPIAVGKTKLAKALADDLGMLYFPEANQDMEHINEYGFNKKELNDRLPSNCKFVDIKDFLLNPHSSNTGRFQMDQFCVKHSQYIDALAHVFNTGQGVVLDRSVYSDFVFMEAMYKQKYLSKGVRDVYYEVRKCCLPSLCHPHLVVYLDLPAEKVLEKIKQRNIPVEVKSPAMNIEYLKQMEKFYKDEYLKDVRINSELLVYDWSTEGDVEIVVEDIERINFEQFYPRENPKFKDWEFAVEEEMGLARTRYTNGKAELLGNSYVVRIEVPELFLTVEENTILHNLMEETPGEQFLPGYNACMGDTGILFKTGCKYRDNLPMRERSSFP